MAQEAHLAGQRLLLDGLLEQNLKSRGVQRLGQVVEGAVTHRLHGALHRAVPGDHEHDGRPAGLLQLLQQREAVHLRQHQVGEHHRRMLGLDQVEGLLGGGRGLDVVTPLTHQSSQAFALGGLVVDDQDLSCLHVIAPAGTHRYRLPSLSPRLIRSCVRCLESRGGGGRDHIDPCRMA